MTINIGNLSIVRTDDPSYQTMTYLLMPVDIPTAHLSRWCAECGTNIAIVYGMDWDNDLTPWPAAGVPRGTPAFQGLAAEFLSRLEMEVAPAVERGLTVTSRNLIGVSLSGLFTLWAWLRDDFFRNIAVLSGSFWYSDFVDWLYCQPMPRKAGKAFFLLGTLEPKSRNRIFATVGTCTDSVLQRLRQGGIDTTFVWVPGTHYAPILPRLDLAFQHLI